MSIEDDVESAKAKEKVLELTEAQRKIYKNNEESLLKQKGLHDDILTSLQEQKQPIDYE